MRRIVLILGTLVLFLGTAQAVDYYKPGNAWTIAGNNNLGNCEITRFSSAWTIPGGDSLFVIDSAFLYARETATGTPTCATALYYSNTASPYWPFAKVHEWTFTISGTTAQWYQIAVVNDTIGPGGYYHIAVGNESVNGIQVGYIDGGVELYSYKHLTATTLPDSWAFTDNESVYWALAMYIKGHSIPGPPKTALPVGIQHGPQEGLLTSPGRVTYGTSP